MSTFRPNRMGGHAAVCTGVGMPKLRWNHAWNGDGVDSIAVEPTATRGWGNGGTLEYSAANVGYGASQCYSGSRVSLAMRLRLVILPKNLEVCSDEFLFPA